MIPSHPVEVLRYVSLIALGVVLLTAKHGTAVSISERIGARPRQYVAMGLALAICGAAFYGFAYFWFGPTYSLPLAFYSVLTVAYIAQLAVAWAIPRRTEPLQSAPKRRRNSCL